MGQSTCLRAISLLITIQGGKPIDGDKLYVTRFDVTTSTDEARSFEYHRRYLDIFTLAAGRERVDIATPAKLTVHEQHDDYWGCRGTPEQSVLLTPGSFLVLFPGDAHRPGMAVTEPENISRSEDLPAVEAMARDITELVKKYA